VQGICTEEDDPLSANEEMLLQRYLWVWGSNLWRNLNAKFILELQAVGLQRLQPGHFFGDGGALLVTTPKQGMKL
jgi:hypothetical protein